MSLIIRNGHFYRDGVLEKPEFGNEEQIKLLRICEKMSEGIGVWISDDDQEDNVINVYFKCICGERIFKRIIGDPIKVLNKSKVSCKCGYSYQYFVDPTDEGSELLVKII